MRHVLRRAQTTKKKGLLSSCLWCFHGDFAGSDVHFIQLIITYFLFDFEFDSAMTAFEINFVFCLALAFCL